MNYRFWLSLTALSAFVAGLQVQAQTALPPFSAFLKANSTIQNIATDPGGNIFVAGQVPSNGQDVFVAKIDPATAKMSGSPISADRPLKPPGVWQSTRQEMPMSPGAPLPPTSPLCWLQTLRYRGNRYRLSRN